MKRVSIFLLFLMILCSNAHAQLLINPSSDGSVFSDGSIYPYYLLTGQDVDGVAIFSTGSLQNYTISNATFSLNPYGLPLWNQTLDVYGFESNSGDLTSSDYNAGTFLGEWNLPNLGYGQKAYFNITDFLQTVNTPYVGFDVRSPGPGDLFSTLDYNYGSPSQLDVDVVPEPNTIYLLGLGFVVFLIRKKRNIFKF